MSRGIYALVSHMDDIGVLLASIQDIGTNKMTNINSPLLKASYRIINYIITTY